MNARTQKAARLAKLRNLVRDVAARHLRALQGRLGDLETERANLIGLLNGDNADCGLMLDAVAKRLRAAAHEAARIELEEQRQSHKLRQLSAQADCTQRHAETAARGERRHDDERRLNEIIDSVLSRPAGS